jgi:hypothetical protein
MASRSHPNWCVGKELRPSTARSDVVAFILPSSWTLVGDLVGALDAAPTSRSVALDLMTPAKRLDLSG